MKSTLVLRVAGAVALLLVNTATLKADNPLGLSDSPVTSSSKPAAKTSSWLPFNLFTSSDTAKPQAPAKEKGPSMMDRVGASFSKMNADTKRVMTRTATSLGLKKKPTPPPSPFGNVGQYSTWNPPKPKKKTSSFSNWFVKPVPRPSRTMDDFFNQPRPGEDSGF